MKHPKALAALCAITLLASTTAWAGGAHCDGIDKSNAEAMAKACTIDKNQAIYSFAVPGAECDGCAHSIQSALLREAGVHCAHVDLEAHVAYVITDKKMSTKSLSKVIQTAGFKNKYRGEGKKVQAEFVKMMSNSDVKSGAACCARAKDKV